MMKVKELIEKLNKCPQDATVYTHEPPHLYEVEFIESMSKEEFLNDYAGSLIGHIDDQTKMVVL